MHPLHFLLRSFGIVQFLRLLQRGRSGKVLISRIIAGLVFPVQRESAVTIPLVKRQKWLRLT